MPKPVFEKHDAAALVKEAVILFQMSNSAVAYELDLPDQPAIIDCDRRLLTQAVTNLVKNAGEAIATAEQSGKKGEDFKGLIRARVYVQPGPGRCVLEVIDNGCGLPSENRQRLTEPYVTTRQKGTGLGLAIVHRIAEQHEGVLELDDHLDENGSVDGAIVRMVIPLERSGAFSEDEESDVQQEFRSAQDQANLRQNGVKQGVGYGV
jgi:two-component system nitrogen regulation sensor histidine kinase NtrY